MSEESRRIDIICQTFSCAMDLANIIHRKTNIIKFAEKSIIIDNSLRNENIFLIFIGSAKAIAYSSDGLIVLTQLFKVGDMIGNNIIFNSIFSSDEVIAIEYVEAGFYSSMNFVEIMESYSCVALAVSRHLTERLSLTTRRMVELTTLSATGRVYAELLRQARATPDLTLRPAPVLQEFALQVHSTRETVSRAVNELERRGIIKRNPGELRVVAPHRLEELIF